MTDRLRELLAEIMSACEMIGHATSGNERANHRASRDKAKVELLAILDAKCDGGAVSELVRTAPEQIYLQISDDESDHEEAFPADHGDEITWCADSVLDCEVKYIRSDLVTRHDSARSGEVSDAAWKDPTGFILAGILDEANNWTLRETGKQMLLNYAAALEHFAKGERHE